MPQRKDYPTGRSNSGQIKTVLQVGFSRELSGSSNNENFLGMRLWRSSNYCTPSGGCWATDGSMIAGCWYSGLLWSCGEGDGTGQIKMSLSLLFLPRNSHFSWINTPGIVLSLWLIPGVLKWLSLTIFSRFVIGFKEGVFVVLTLPFLRHHPEPYILKFSFRKPSRFMWISPSFIYSLTWPSNIFECPVCQGAV